MIFNNSLKKFIFWNNKNKRIESKLNKNIFHLRMNEYILNK